MTFERSLRVSSILLILTGFYTILITGGYGLPVAAGMIITIAYGILGERLQEWLRVPRWFWNIVALILVSYFGYESFFGDQDLVGNAIKFVIYLQIVKLLSPKNNRDHLQIFLLSFMHVLASTVLSAEIGFAVPFVVYVVLATWTLAGFNLKVQQENAARPEVRQAVLRSLLRSKNILTPQFLGFTSVLSVMIIAFTLLMFFLFPRFSMRQFFKRSTTHQRVSGFSEEVELGTLGNIKTNSSVVMRVELPEHLPPGVQIERLYWRGTASDFFDGRRWSKTVPGRTPVGVDMETGVLPIERRVLPNGIPFRYRVFLEALSTPILFGADRVYRLSWDKPYIERFFRRSMRLERDHYLGFYFVSADNFLSDLSYMAESLVGEPAAETLGSETGTYSRALVSDYLQIPPLDPGVRELIQAIPLPPNATPFQKVRGIQTYLENNYRYTLDVNDRGTQDPLRFFFIDQKQGHCEYFSTALIIALRLHGIPARQTMGFRGGELNEYGNYIAIRQSDAHSWVEVYYPKSGWVVADPSPLDSTVRQLRPRFAKMNQFFDYLRLRWAKYIVEYDLQAQAAIVEKVGRQFTRFGQTDRSMNLEKDPTGLRWGGKSIPKRWLWLGGAILLSVLFVLIWRNRHSRKALRRSRFQEVELLLHGHGYDREYFQTPHELSTHVQAKEGNLPALRTLTRLYYDERFGGFDLPEAEWRSAIESLRDSLQSRRKAA